MPTPTKGPRFGGSPSHQRLILANLAQNLIEHGKITTTEAKAKRLRPYVEHLITKAKTDTVANRRQVVKVIRDKDILHTLFTEVGPAMATRPGGYTRITKVAPRKGDNAPMAIIEIVESKDFPAQNSSAQNQTPKQKDATVSAPAEAPADEAVSTEVEEPVEANDLGTDVDVEATDDAAAAAEEVEAAGDVEVEADVETEAPAEEVLENEAPANGAK